MSPDKSLKKFSNLSFDDFRMLAKDQTLSRHEKVGFPDSYRSGKEKAIFNDVRRKVPQLMSREKTVFEIGPGCSELPLMLAKLCKENSHKLVFIDSQEMLSYLPEDPQIVKYSGTFPEALGKDQKKFRGKVNVVLAYSVIQYVYSRENIFVFLDTCLSLLAEGGEILFGDIPNITMRKRFLCSRSGTEFHKQFVNTNKKPAVKFNQVEFGNMDDSVVLAILARARAQGFHAWILPQEPSLPMANRREDILIRKP